MRRTMPMRGTISVLMVALSGSALPTIARAQTPEPTIARAQTLQAEQPQAPDSGAQKPAEPDEQKPAQPPPAAVGEEGIKPRRGFFSALSHNLKDDVSHLPRWNTLLVLGTGTALAIAVHPKDRNINGHLVGTADTLWKPGAFLAAPVIVGASLTTYIVGRAKSAPRAQHLGMDELEAEILTGAIVFGMKESFRRDRPLSPEGQPQSGFSFPSGHAASTFAAATVLQQHLGYRAGVPTYLFASYVAMSRLHDNRHFASDVVFGSALGIMVGRTVTWHGRHFYGLPMLMPNGAGVMVSLNP